MLITADFYLHRMGRWIFFEPWTTIKDKNESSLRRKDPDNKVLPSSATNWTDKQTPTADGRITLTDAQTQLALQEKRHLMVTFSRTRTLSPVLLFCLARQLLLVPSQDLFFLTLFQALFYFTLLFLSAAGFAGNGDRIEGKDVIFIFLKSKITK